MKPDELRTETFTQLTAPGSTTGLRVSNNIYHTMQYKLANKNTNVVVKLQGSLDNTNWFDITSEATQTANGTYYLSFEGIIKYIRFTFVSESGGTAATLDVIYLGA